MMESKENKEVAVADSAGNAKRTKILIAVLSALVVLAGVAITVLLMRDNTQVIIHEVPQEITREIHREVHQEIVTEGRGTVVTPENVEEILANRDRPVEDGHYRTIMNVDWIFPNSSEPSVNAFVENSTSNSRTVYFDLVLAETNELVYSSPFIPVGSRLEKFTLDAFVPAGVHSGIVTYHLVDDDYREITSVSVGVTLQIME